ncbi:hypothetical protein [Oscillatoria sp. FACHB-1406]|uniref:hypothetical protein n=1 Tax=Oscillatoria sp. FACHB-1406 TaxID=2692846 RepID=UPI0016829678|nr:hypothetical protein [Oscillatoria sp. FACHB-1406]MBD2577548.1 hypothetical protein [Oscillatoria sp. FACHB-1406]
MKKICRWGLQYVLTVCLIFSLVACGAPTPPISLAPGGEIIQKAIALSLEQSQQQLSERLQASNPGLKITRVNVEQIEPMYIGKLAAYHFMGTYNLKVAVGDREVTQKDNDFNIYIQRQKEGKTWRWLKQVASDSETAIQWLSYLIR